MNSDQPAMDHPSDVFAQPGQVWALPPEEALTRINSDSNEGLSNAEANRRLREHGSNTLKRHKKRSIWSIFIEQFRSIIIGLLAVATLVAFLFGEWVEGWAIMVVILINTLLGFFTELRAVRSMEALFKLGRVTTRVRRNGKVTEVDAEDLVPGDIVVVEGGDVITADLRILQSSKLQADESELTGESLPVSKQVAALDLETVLAERSNMLYKGTSITRGSGEGVVTATGLDTELGHISSLVEHAAESRTPLEERLDKLGNRLIIVTLLITVFVAISGIVAGKDLFLMIETGIALAVAAIPEGLPIVATLALAKGLRVMARKNALINRLSSVETLGATGIVCTDKTGTLTENRMTVTRFLLPGKDIEYDRADINKEVNIDTGPVSGFRLALETAVLCNNATLSDEGSSGTGDPLEIALLAAGRKAGMELQNLRQEYPEEKEEAFDPDQKMMATWNKVPSGGYRVHVKGAPGAVFDVSEYILENGEVKPFTQQKKEEWRRVNQTLGGEGLRIIAVAYKESDRIEDNAYNKLVFIGLIALIDPPRKEVKGALARCRQAGIRVIMITGDQMATAKYIAEAVGMDDGEEIRAYHGKDLPGVVELEASIDMRQSVLKANIFARINPQQKLDLIEFYQNNGHIVAMTGDGVNDAPALKKADIGIAMGKRGTQVAREAADMVLTDDAFSTIVAAIEQGRVIFGNIRRFIYYLMSCNMSEVLVVGMASLIGAPLPVLPLQILFLNLVTDVFPALALGVGEGEEGLMERPPREPDEPILSNSHWIGIAGYGLIITASVLAVLWIGLRVLYLEGTAAVTLSFLTLGLSQLWHVFNMRSNRSGIFSNTITRNSWVWGALGLCIVIILTAVYVPPVATVLQVHPPSIMGWMVVVGFSLVPLLTGQVGKAVRARK